MLGSLFENIFPNYLLEEDLKMSLINSVTIPILRGEGGMNIYRWPRRKIGVEKKYEIVIIFMGLERCLSGSKCKTSLENSLNSVPWTHTRTHNHPQLQLQGVQCLFWDLLSRTHPQPNTHIHTTFEKKITPFTRNPLEDPNPEASLQRLQSPWSCPSQLR